MESATLPNEAKNGASKSDTFDVSLVGRARAGFRLPISGPAQSQGSQQQTVGLALGLLSPPSAGGEAPGSGLQVRGVAARYQARTVPASDKISASSSKDLGDSPAASVCGSLGLEDVRSPELVRTGYVLSFTLVIAATCLLEGRGNVFALNLAILSALPLLSATMVFHGMEAGRPRRSLLAAAGATLLAGSGVSVIVSNGTLSLTRHLPGLAVVCLFFYLMSTSWRRILSVVCSVLVLLCVVLSMVIDANFENKQTLVLTTVLIFGLLFVQSHVAVTPMSCRKDAGRGPRGGDNTMAFTLAFVMLQAVVAIVFLALTSKVVGPEVALYDTKLSPTTVQQLLSGNATYVVMGGDSMPVHMLDGVAVDGGNRLFLYRLNPLTVGLSAVMLLTIYVIYTFLKLPESSHHCSKISPDDDYCGESLQDHTHWVFCFSVCMVFCNFAIISFVCFPRQLDSCVLLAYIIGAQVEVVIAPREGEENGLQSLARTLCGMVVLLLWMFVWAKLRQDIDGVIFIFIFKILLEFMIVGYHTGSKRVMEHVVECRVLYAVCNTFLLVTVYLAWGHWRPPSDVYGHATSTGSAAQPFADPYAQANHYRSMASSALGAPSRAVVAGGFSSPYHPPANYGIADTLDFRDGIEIMEDEPPPPEDGPKSVAWEDYSSDEERASPPSPAAVSKRDLQAMIERNLKQNCGGRYQAKSRISSKATEPAPVPAKASGKQAGKQAPAAPKQAPAAPKQASAAKEISLSSKESINQSLRRLAETSRSEAKPSQVNLSSGSLWKVIRDQSAR
ncbi:hypothetical protein GUITHDRAFT_118759 [Guillardia theta CCMP2712]|uniref:Uncharacterized protein n=1 Tax=Guillardia theta (strain CCMP2712) TaxID=905079 RepID=L1IFR8_GUITC|nr:hypothetical protein GUITHDRAFT_118759 [Guillardia theta CCMP2712]EKX35106.1 hypothetical protein GUITHDRAFT_118759 [Guillardia theta CCMP2712]|eukprot:XP_005822086.1 hypothetical protein GUITHDRAFT_118759 [Guillardia theta CCMP2712]